MPEAPRSRSRRHPDLNAPKAAILHGFTEIFNGKDTAGWHVSRTNHDGTMPLFRVLDGILVGTQIFFAGKGGILLTDKQDKNVDGSMEVKRTGAATAGCSCERREAGEADQVTLDDLPGGAWAASTASA